MGGLFDLDAALFRAIHVEYRREWLDPVMRTLSDSGLGHVQLLALLVVAFGARARPWALGVFTVAWGTALLAVERDATSLVAAGACMALFAPVRRATLRQALLAAVVAGVVRLPLVSLFDRVRPSNLPYATPLEAVYGSSSFPSGHATTTAAIATVFALAVRDRGEHTMASIVCLWAILVAFSRIYVGVHFPSDVLGGVALGSTVAAVVYFLFDAKGVPTPLESPTES